MISNFLQHHPQILSLSEFFSMVTDLGTRIAEAIPTGVIDAATFWQILASPRRKQTIMHQHGVSIDEVLYRVGSGTRFTAQHGVPPLLQTTLPHLVSEPETFFDEVEAFVAAQSDASAPAHYARLFEWLVERFGKRTWVERSGGSLRAVHRLAQAFPQARFVHLVRDGRDCAASMSRHFGFRMVFIALQLTEILGVDPFESTDRTWVADIPDEIFPLLPEHFDGEAFRRYVPPLPLCGHYWSGEILAGLAELSALSAERVLTLRYEDFVTTPREAVTRLAAFLLPGASEDAWTDRTIASVRPSPFSWTQLPAEERLQLEDACRPGLTALRTLYAA